MKAFFLYRSKMKNSLLKLVCLGFVSYVTAKGHDILTPQLLFPILMNVSDEKREFDYCDLDCNGTKHTMCQYPAGGGDKCANNLKVYLTVAEKRYIEDNLNRIRYLVATGKDLLLLPKASNMMKLVWDRELSTIAKRWADQCNQPCHDKCRITQDEVDTGQNVYFGTYAKGSFASRTEIKMARIKEALGVWEAEKKLFDRRWITSYYTDTKNTTGNFSQIVWATTEFVGCGYTEFKEATSVVSRFVCNFKGSGNIDYRKVYREGEPCSKCPSRSVCSETYEGLCWNKLRSNYRELVVDAGSRSRTSVAVVMVCCTISVFFLPKDCLLQL